MICPVCEHQQAFGVECEVCGKDLGGLGDLGPPPVMATRIEGLEATMNESTGEVPVEKLGELEITRHDAVAAVPLEVTPDLEITANAPVGEVQVERVADLSVDRAAPDSRTPMPQGPVTCRYCRNVQAAGAMCERCGMKLPVVIVVPEAMAVVKGKAVVEKTRCRSCGAPATAGERCGDCGREVPFPDA